MSILTWLRGLVTPIAFADRHGRTWHATAVPTLDELAAMPGDWVQQGPGIRIQHLDGVPWHDFPLPPDQHRCWAQTRGWADDHTMLERCPCGGMRIPAEDKHWTHRNERRPA